MTRDYESALDIVSAYKSLKQAVSKPATVHGGNNQNTNKGYLKMTIAATQHSKSKVAKDLLEYSLATSKHNALYFNLLSFRTKSSFKHCRGWS